jgi:hypothetical protein
MVSELIRLWSKPGDGVVVHTPAYDAFYKAIEGNASCGAGCDGETGRWLAGQYGRAGSGAGETGKQNPAAVQPAKPDRQGLDAG